MAAEPRPAAATASHPRLPAASVPGTCLERLNVRPASVERDVRSVDPVPPVDVHTTTISGDAPLLDTSATWGGCSPLIRASPGVELTRTGGENVTAALSLTAA